MVDRVSNFQAQEIMLGGKTITISGHVARQPLSPNFQPSAWTVICGRGKAAFSHVGNQRLRILVESNLAAYSAATSKYAKTLIVSNIVDTIRSAAKEGAFVKLDSKTKKYIETGDAASREKVGQLFREAIAKQNPEKLQKRKEARKAKALKRKALARMKSDRSASSGSSVATEETSALSDSESPSQMSPASSLDNLFDPLPMQANSRASVILTGLQNISDFQNVQFV